jgi:hypothetical protein
MSYQDLVNQIAEEIKVGNDLGYEEEHIAKNILAIMKGNREHMDHNPSTHQYDWETER